MIQNTQTEKTTILATHDWVWLPSLAMMGCSFLSYLDRQMLAVLSPMILRDTNLSTTAYATIISFFSIAYMLGNPVWGVVLDRIGLRRGMSFSVGLWTAASAAHAGLTGFWGFGLARALLGFGEGATFPGGLRTATDTLPPEKRSRGIALTYSGGSLGAVLTPLIVTPLALRYGWRAAFILTGVVGTAWVFWWRRLMKRAPQSTNRTSVLPRVTEPRFWALVCGYGLGALPLYLAPIHLTKVLGLTQAQLGRVLWIPPLGWEIGYFFWGWVADRYAATEPRPMRLILLLMVGSLPLALTSGTHNVPLVLGLLFLAMFVAAGYVVFALRYGAMSYPREHTALVAGIGAGSWSALVALVMPILGRLFDQGQYHLIFLIVSLAPVAGTVGWWFFSQRASQQR